jgi:hypothetical protein
MSNNLRLDILVLDTHNPKTLGIGDISFYPQGLPIINPSIQITPPSFNRITLPYTAKNLTIYDSNILGITCGDSSIDCDSIDLPDGIWQIKYTITPATERYVSKSFLRTEKIQQEWGEAFLSTDINKGSSKSKELKKAELDDAWALIQGAVADANNGNDVEAMNKYRLASSMLKVFNKNQ